MPEALAKHAPNGSAPVVETLLGFDVGERKIGVAVGSSLAPPRPLLVLPAQPEAELLRRLKALMAEWRPDRLVVGLPLTMDGAEQAASRRSRAFSQQLRELCDRPVVEADERLSTFEARRRFAGARASGQARQGRGKPLDALAAAVILEGYLLSGSTSERGNPAESDLAESTI